VLVIIYLSTYHLRLNFHSIKILFTNLFCYLFQVNWNP
jgi:hypothetical protein